MNVVEAEENTADILSHDDLLEFTESTLKTLLKNDSLLQDLPDDILIEEIQSQIAVEHGQLITIFINREKERALKVAVPQDATVRDLKKAIAKQFEHFKRRHRIQVKISWKYIWKTFSLNYDSIALDNNDACIQDYGVVNRVTLSFNKKKHQKKQTM